MCTLRIPKEFTFDMLSDGSPILEVLNEGTPLTSIQEDGGFHLIFGLITYNTTNLPPNYTLEITSTQISLRDNITPKWPVDDGGSGAAIDCYISSFYAYDTTKGNNVHVVTYIYNPNFLESDAWGLKFRLIASEYSDWTDQWTPGYNGGNINPYSTLVVHSYLQKVFTAQSGKKYAFNTGTFRVNQVYVEGDTWGDPWTDTYDPSITQGEFVITIQSGTHPVFVVHLRDSDHTSEFGSGNFLDTVETRQFKYNGQDTSTKEHFDIDFISIEPVWTPDEYDLQYLYDTQLKEDAGDLLGLSGDWDIRSGTKGTDQDNHGFDLVIGSSGKPNYIDSGEDYYSCFAYIHGNYIVTMDGWHKYWWLYSDYNTDQMKRATLHEIFHTYDAVNGGGHIGSDGWIMSNTVQFGGWKLHTDTNSDVNDNIAHFDGPP